MNRAQIKQSVYSIFFLVLGISTPTMANGPAQELAKAHLRHLLRERPELAEKFLKEVAKKDGGKPAPKGAPAKKPTPKPAPAPKPAPVKKAEPKPEPVPTPAPAPEQPKPWMTDSELSDLNTIFTVLESNSMRVLACLNAFFCKTNCQSYQTHVNCLKNQISYLQENLLSKFPSVETAERRSIFQGFHEIAKTLEQGETTILKVIDPKPAGLWDFNKKYNAVYAILETLQKKINQIANRVRGELRPDLRPRMSKLQTKINQMFNFGQTLPTLQLPGIISHRLKT